MQNKLAAVEAAAKVVVAAGKWRMREGGAMRQGLLTEVGWALAHVGAEYARLVDGRDWSLHRFYQHEGSLLAAGRWPERANMAGQLLVEEFEDAADLLDALGTLGVAHADTLAQVLHYAGEEWAEQDFGAERAAEEAEEERDRLADLEADRDFRARCDAGDPTAIAAAEAEPESGGGCGDCGRQVRTRREQQVALCDACAAARLAAPRELRRG